MVRLVLRQLLHERFTTLLFLLCFGLLAALPLGLHRLVGRLEEGMTERAERSPLLLGRRGGQLQLVLAALHFRGAAPEALTFGDFENLSERWRGAMVPLHLGGSLAQRPLIGTDPSYFEFRGLHLARGSAFALLGELVLGAEAAEELEVQVGTLLRADTGGAFDLTRSEVPALAVVGILAKSATADDGAVFADLSTAWMVEGLLHGHAGAGSDPAAIDRSDDRTVVYSPLLPTATAIDPTELSAFHLHLEPESAPLHAILLEGTDQAEETMLLADLDRDERLFAVRPVEVVEELLALVFRVREAFDLVLAAVFCAVAMLLSVVVLLSWRVRREEFALFETLGAPKGFAATLVALQLLVLLLAGTALAAVLVEVLARGFERGW
ncbi:MAG: hypothetical protein A2284_02750 [Deltaproteobacteria bacterium RIFOXYA12_FULL_61_11]|nr:MAG: hypothetical protein A2284_02750 [Deltaproteobacteria bacterium RIFOXYA12_FULL_61_11]